MQRHARAKAAHGRSTLDGKDISSHEYGSTSDKNGGSDADSRASRTGPSGTEEELDEIAGVSDSGGSIYRARESDEGSKKPKESKLHEKAESRHKTKRGLAKEKTRGTTKDSTRLAGRTSSDAGADECNVKNLDEAREDNDKDVIKPAIKDSNPGFDGQAIDFGLEHELENLSIEDVENVDDHTEATDTVNAKEIAPDSSHGEAGTRSVSQSPYPSSPHQSTSTPQATVSSQNSWLGGWSSWITSAQAIGSDLKAKASAQVDKLYEVLDPALDQSDSSPPTTTTSVLSESSNEMGSDKDTKSPPKSAGSEKSDRSIRDLFDHNEPGAAKKLLRVVDKTLDFASEALESAMLEIVGRPTSASPTASVSSRTVTPEPSVAESPRVEPHETPKLSKKIGEVGGKAVVSGISALEKFGRTTADYVSQASGISSGSAAHLVSNITVQDPNMSVMDLFEQYGGQEALEELQFASTEAAIKLKKSLRSMTAAESSRATAKLARLEAFLAPDRLVQAAGSPDTLFEAYDRLANNIPPIIASHPGTGIVLEKIRLVISNVERADVFVKTASSHAASSDSNITPIIAIMYSGEFAKLAAFACQLYTQLVTPVSPAGPVDCELLSAEKLASIVIELFSMMQQLYERHVLGDMDVPNLDRELLKTRCSEDLATCITVLQDAGYSFVPILKMAMLEAQAK